MKWHDHSDNTRVKREIIDNICVWFDFVITHNYYIIKTLLPH